LSELFEIGSRVVCAEGPLGTLACVVVDPVLRSVTHVVVEPEHAPGQGRLVAVELVCQHGESLELRCSRRDFEQLEFAEETHFTSPDGADLGYGEGEVMTWPYYGIGLDMGAGEIPNSPRPHFESRVPVGEVEVRRGERVHAADGDFGRVNGFIVDPADHHITHLVVEVGSLFSRHQVAVAITAVSAVDDDGVTISLTRDEVRALPRLDLPG
jgi:hypothetical protein